MITTCLTLILVAGEDASDLCTWCISFLIGEIKRLARIEGEAEIERYRVLSLARLSSLPQSPLHTAGLTAAQYGKNLMPPGTQSIWILSLPLSQAQAVQKNCSGLILEASQIHTAGISAYSFLGGGTQKKVPLFWMLLWTVGWAFPLKLCLLWGWRGVPDSLMLLKMVLKDIIAYMYQVIRELRPFWHSPKPELQPRFQM